MHYFETLTTTDHALRARIDCDPIGLCHLLPWPLYLTIILSYYKVATYTLNKSRKQVFSTYISWFPPRRRSSRHFGYAQLHPFFLLASVWEDN